MKPQYQIEGKTLSAFTFSLEFDYRIKEVIHFDCIFIVLLDPADENGRLDNSPVRDNVYGIDEPPRKVV